MTASIHKEIRSLAPVLIITVVLTSAASLVFNGRDSTSLVNLVFGFCCLIMGAISLGNEYQARTMMLLLAQPKPRQRIWGQKMLVLGLALALAYGATLLSVQFLMSGEGAGQDNFLGRIFILLPVPVLVFCTAPFVTLVVKNTLGAVVFTVIVSALICLVFFGNVWLLHKCFPQLIEQMKDDRRIFALGALYFGPSAICCAAIYWLGYRKFMNLEMIDGQGQEVALPVKLEVVLGAALKRFLPGYTGPTASLIRKELQLQRASFIVAGVVGALLLAEAVWRAASQSQMNEGWLQATFILYVFVIPFLTGSVCMAEERNWGVAAWQFTLPPAAMQQGVIKLMVTGLTFLMLGIVFPLLILLVGQKWLGLYPKIFDAGRLWDWIAGVHMYLAVFSLVVLASSFSRNTLRAILISFGLILVLTGLEEAFFHLWQNIGHPNEFGQQSEVEAGSGLMPIRLAVDSAGRGDRVSQFPQRRPGHVATLAILVGGGFSRGDHDSGHDPRGRAQLVRNADARGCTRGIVAFRRYEGLAFDRPCWRVSGSMFGDCLWLIAFSQCAFRSFDGAWFARGNLGRGEIDELPIVADGPRHEILELDNDFHFSAKVGRRFPSIQTVAFFGISLFVEFSAVLDGFS